MTCPRCQTPYEPGHAYCMHCGMPLTPTELNVPHAQGAEDELPPTVMRRPAQPTAVVKPEHPAAEAHPPAAAMGAAPREDADAPASREAADPLAEPGGAIASAALPPAAGADAGASAPRTMEVSGPLPTIYADLAAAPQHAPPGSGLPMAGQYPQPATPYTPYPSLPYAPTSSQPYTPYPSQPYAPPATPYTPYPSQPYAPPDATIISSAPFSPPASLPPYSSPPSFGSLPSYAPSVTGAGPIVGAKAPSSPFLPDIFGLDASPLTAQPRTALQVFLLRNVSQRFAVGKWFTAALGAVVALAAGLLLTLVCQAVWGAAIGDAMNSAGPGGAGLASYAQGALTPDLLRLFAIEHHIPLTASASSGMAGFQISGSGSISLPILGLLLAPALALVLGGAVASSSDYVGRTRFSVARGALIAPFYAILLTICAFLDSSSSSGQAFNVSLSGTESPSPVGAFLYGLLWGALFGALGGWIQYAGRGAFTRILPTLQGLRNQRLAGALAGAGVAFCTGILLATVVAVGFFVYALIQTVAHVVPSGGQSGAVTSSPGFALVAMLVLMLGLPVAISGLAMSSGAALTTSGSLSGLASTSQSSSFGLIGAQHGPTSALTYLVMLLPFVAYAVGGRIAARVAGAKTRREALTAGALMAVPLSLLLAGATALCGFSADLSTIGLAGGISAGVSPWGTLLAVLVFGAAAGALGGASLFDLPALGNLPHALATPLRPLAVAFGPRLDRLTAHPTGPARGRARTLVYDGVCAAVVLGVIVIVLDIVGPMLAPALPFDALAAVYAWAGALLAAVPALFFIAALLAALAPTGATASSPVWTPALVSGPAVPLEASVVGPVGPVGPAGPAGPLSMPAMPSMPSMPSGPQGLPPVSTSSDPPTNPGQSAQQPPE